VIEAPERLAWWSEFRGGADWLESLPRLAAESAERRRLRLGPPFGNGVTSLVLPAEHADGSSAVLKLTAPHAASEHEGDALAYWDGRGAVRLLAHDRERRALLLERCEPGDLLWPGRTGGSSRTRSRSSGNRPPAPGLWSSCTRTSRVRTSSSRVADGSRSTRGRSSARTSSTPRRSSAIAAGTSASTAPVPAPACAVASSF
jgi:hypothetical protein